MEQTHPVVLSASRRTDLVGCYPEYFIEKLKNYPPENVHTIVIWTKNPINLIYHTALSEVLKRYSQLYLHLTITGLGGTILEPRIPPWSNVVELLPQLIKLVGSPARISWRFDPIVHAEAGAHRFANVGLFPVMAKAISRQGITTCRTSWTTPYKKVLQRLQQKGLLLKTLSYAEQINQAQHLREFAERLGIELFFCSMDGFPRSRCIDGELLNKLHPNGLVCSTTKAKGQRAHCGCTESLDIGWYSLKCAHGCLYCYAEPNQS